MTRVRASLFAWSSLALAAPLLVGVDRAWAEDAPNIVWTAKADPDRVAAGGKGTLVITGAIRKKVHVYADKRFRVKPTAVAGVEYGFPEKPPPVKWQDPTDKEAPPEDVYLEKVEVKVPFTLAADAKLPLTVSASIEWSCCDDEQCFGKETTKPPPSAEIKAPEGKEPPPTPVSQPASAPAGTSGPTDPAPGTPSPTSPPAPVAPAAPGNPATVASPPPAAAPAAPAAAPSAFRVSTTIKTDDVTATIVADEKRFAVTFAPTDGMVVHPPGSDGEIIVKGVTGAGVTWGALAAPTTEPEIKEPYEVSLPYTSAGDAPLAVLVSWTACDLQSGLCHLPEPLHRVTLDRKASTPTLTAALDLSPIVPVGVAATQATPAPIAPPVGAAGPPAALATTGIHVPEKGLLFEEVGKREESAIERALKGSPVLALLLLFAIGIGLAFTPCVLPLVPITVSLIGGGNSSVTRSRLAFLLGCYVLGLSLAFGSMGLAAAKLGASMSAAFDSPVGIFTIAGIFWALSFGMFGVYELQPPAWAQRLQGGAKGGNPIGAFLLGGMGALIASPCTGPVIASLVVFTAQSGNVLYGFLLFFTLGLGMGAVLFAAGSLNLLMKPGPWMVWVRYTFGVILVGAALYYLRSGNRVGPYGALAIGFCTAALAAVLIGRHLVAKEGEDRHVAYARGVKVALVTVVATGFAVFLTRDPSHGSAFASTPGSTAVADAALTWKNVTSREQMVAEVEESKRAGRWTVVDVWAQTCYYCKKYDPIIEASPRLKAAFLKAKRLRMDLSEDPDWEAGLREGLGMKPVVRPVFVFIDPLGRIHRDLDIEGFKSEEVVGWLEKRADAIEGEKGSDRDSGATKTSSAVTK